MMRVRFIILTTLIALSCFSTAYAADEVITENITLQQAKNLVYENGRELKKYEISTSKTKYQLKQAENNINNMLDDYNAASQDTNTKSEYEKIVASIDTSSYENSYDDAVSDEDNYKKELDYIVENLYTNILNQEANLVALNKEYDLKQSLYQVEKAKLFLGSTNQVQLDEMLAEIKNLNQKIIEQTNSVKIVKGNLNDMMGRQYDEELNLSPFEVAKTLEIPEYDQLFSDALVSYDVISHLKRDINESEDDLETEDDYYQYLILNYQIDEKELQLDDEQSTLKESINNLIADAKGKQENYQISLSNYNNAQKQFNWDKTRHQLGQLSKLDLLQSELDYLNMQNQKLAAEYNLYLAQRTLELASDGILIK